MDETAAKKAKLAHADADLQKFIDSTNANYEQLHLAFENQFWGTKMALKGEYSPALLNSTKTAMEAMLADKSRLDETRKWLATGKGDETQIKTLNIFQKTFLCYIMEAEEAQTLRTKCTEMETELEGKRNVLKLGHKSPDGFVEMSSVGLRNAIRSNKDEVTRKACFDGLREIGPFVCNNGFAELVKQRNKMARLLGYVDFYDYKVTQAEGFNKERLFQMLDTLEKGSRPIMEKARAELAAKKGASALEPWNTNFLTSGDVTAKKDPYFPFHCAVQRWGESYQAMGIKYQGAEMVLDLLDRKGKYSNGFCHWPQPAWRKPDGSFQPSRTNFTSLADPKAVGSGITALTTLMHEAGHAAHFANIDQPSPLFSQERAPTSVAYAENQSMFLDSVVGDAAWRGRYCRNDAGEVIPWDIIKEDLECNHPYAVFMLRSMLAVPYFEKALYELPEGEVTAERILSLADEIEQSIQGGPATRPLLSVPHILSDESACYYHGYVLAEMSVHQTRAHFLKTYGQIVDNPKVGQDLTTAYWRPGNSRPFLDLVQELTGAPLTGDAWIKTLQQPLAELIAEERKDYDEAIKSGGGSSGTPVADVDLNMRVRIMDGDEPIADSEEGGFLPMCTKFSEYVKNRYGKAK